MNWNFQRETEWNNSVTSINIQKNSNDFEGLKLKELVKYAKSKMNFHSYFWLISSFAFSTKISNNPTLNIQYYTGSCNCALGFYGC